MIARVYRNLNKGGLSIKTKVDGKWKVTDYSTQVIMIDCTFKVQQGGRNRVLKDRQKNVHAWVEGTLISTSHDDYIASNASVPYYNPYTQDHFTIDNVKVESAKTIKLFCEGK